MGCPIEEIKENSLKKAKKEFIDGSTMFRQEKDGSLYIGTTYKLSISKIDEIIQKHTFKVKQWASNTFGENFSKNWVIATNVFNTGFSISFSFPKNLEEAYEIKIEKEKLEKEARSLQEQDAKRAGIDYDDKYLFQETERDLSTISKEEISNLQSTVDYKIKPGVQELFESNPELANAVYEALAFKDISKQEELLTIDEKEIPGKEGESFSEMNRRVIQNINIRKRLEIAAKNNIVQGKSYSFLELKKIFNNDKLFDNEIYQQLNTILQSSNLSFKFGSLNKGKKSINGYYNSTNNSINIDTLVLQTSDFKRILLHEIIHAATFINLGENASLTNTQKTALNNLNNLILELKKDRDFFAQYGLTNVNELLAELANEQFVDKLKKKTFSDNQSFFEKIISEIVKLLGLKTTAYDIVKESFDNLVKDYNITTRITPQQKQQALQLYSQYLDSIFPESKVKDIVYHGTLKKENILKEGYSIKEAGKKGNKAGIFFYSYAEDAAIIGDILFNIVNITNPLVTTEGRGLTQEQIDEYEKQGIDGITIPVNPDLKEQIENFRTNPPEKLSKKSIDSIISSWEKTLKEGLALETIVFKPSQTHILGSTQDIEGFKEFVKSNSTQEIKSEEIETNYKNFINLKPSSLLTEEDWNELTPEEKEMLINQTKNC